VTGGGVAAAAEVVDRYPPMPPVIAPVIAAFPISPPVAAAMATFPAAFTAAVATTLAAVEAPALSIPAATCGAKYATATAAAIVRIFFTDLLIVHLLVETHAYVRARLIKPKLLLVHECTRLWRVRI
jgi:hypothetical protein